MEALIIENGRKTNMITGPIKTEINREFIFSRIETYDIFRMYYPHGQFKLNRACKSPFTEDDNPSCIIGDGTGEVIFKCFNSENRGDCFDFVMQLFNINYQDALYKIARDFSLLSGDDSYRQIISAYTKPKDLEANIPTLLQAVNKPWNEESKAYWKQYSLEPKDLRYCKDTRCYPTLRWYINRIRQPLSDDELCFFYHLKNERGQWIKMYKPYADKKDKWKSSVPHTEMFGVGNISGGCNIGIVTKSYKDGAVLAKYISPHIEIVQAEDSCALSPDNMKRLKASCKELYISFDNDSKGVQSSIELVKELGCKYINPPKYLYDKGITDWADWIKAEGVHPIIDFFKEKKVLLDI